MSRLVTAILTSLLAGNSSGAAELLLPQNRNAYYSDEVIELAVAGLDRGAQAAVELAPLAEGPRPLRFAVAGDGSTAHLSLPSGALAAGTYALRLGGQDTGQKLTISSGVSDSTMLLSQTIGWDDLRAAGANFAVGNAFSFGLVGPDGLPLREVRGRRSPGLEAFERALALDLPTLVYMYWTGYVTHKPWGADKSWCDPKMVETMRLFSLHAAQRLRRYRRNILSVGTLDEPGLSWGRTPAGGSASGFPNWCDQEWYESRGWPFTHDIAAGSDADWMKYMAIRCSIIRESNEWAKRDLRAVWPDVAFATDLYAPHAVMDGTDPLSQTVNDLPTTHVFLDWGMGKLGTIGAVYLEKAHDPAAHVAHAMNGQLFGPTVPQPAQRDAYRVMLNGLLAAGLHSNWWLNCTGMSREDLAAINEPGKRWGPLFREMSPAGHNVAVLWSFTELCMREKELAAQEARKPPGESMKLLVTGLPESSAFGPEGAEIDLNAYSVGGNYREQVLTAHQALSRAGYPAHILHDRLLARGALRPYKALVIVGQTFRLPEQVMRALRQFTASGGRLVVDRTATVPLEGAVVTDANFRDPAYRWGPLFTADPQAFDSPREASYFQTNHFMDTMAREAVVPVKEALRRAGVRPAVITESADVAVERHIGGEGALYLVLNGAEGLPGIAPDQTYPIYNYAPQEVTYSLAGVPRGSVVYRVEGPDWSRVTEVSDPSAPQTATFAPGEMKLHLVAPRRPQGLRLSARQRGWTVEVTCGLKGLRMPWPLVVNVTGPGGSPAYHVYRATNAQGAYAESFPIGSTAGAGACVVSVESPVGGLSAQTEVRFLGGNAVPQVATRTVRVFDQEAIRAFLQGRPDVVVALGNPSRQALAEELAEELRREGVVADVRPEGELVQRARYPRVWDPHIRVYQPTGDERPPSQTPTTEVTLESAPDGRTVAGTAAGADLGDEWAKPGTLATVTGEGYIDLPAEAFYASGCKLLVDGNGQRVVVLGEPTEVRTTDEVRERWSRPWTRLSSFLGTDKLCPQLPEAYSVDSHLILLGDSTSSELTAALQASELLAQVVDAGYPGPGKALVSFAWSPFALGRNVVLVGAADDVGLSAGCAELLKLAGGG